MNNAKLLSTKQTSCIVGSITVIKIEHLCGRKEELGISSGIKGSVALRLLKLCMYADIKLLVLLEKMVTKWQCLFNLSPSKEKKKKTLKTHQSAT